MKASEFISMYESAKTIDDLAEELGVTPRCVNKYVNLLKKKGMKIKSRREHCGGKLDIDELNQLARSSFEEY